jgi:curved DNA-binding protein CbpA
MTSHYDVLGVAPSATYEEIRSAYHDKARRLHPDAAAGQPPAEQESRRRAMQDVNEAWRVLRDPGRRAAYDRASARSAPSPAAAPTSEPDSDWDRPFHGRAAEPGDVTVALIRAAPWVAVLVVLAVIVVFTAFARHGGTARDLVGKCIVTEQGEPHEVPCDEPSDGRVVSVVDTEAHCAEGTTARVVASGDWFCLVDE